MECFLLLILKVNLEIKEVCSKFKASSDCDITFFVICVRDVRHQIILFQCERKGGDGEADLSPCRWDGGDVGALLMLLMSGVRYIDQRLTADQFNKVKPRLPYGQLPTIKVEGEVVCTSMAIARLLADKYGLAGNNNLERAQADEIVDTVNDIINKRIVAMFETNEEKKLELMRELMTEFIPSTLARLEARLKERGGQFFVGNNLSWADLHVFCLLERARLDNAEVSQESCSQHYRSPSFYLLSASG